MINNPLVSILIPNFNKAPYLRETLNCILEQTYTEWECIIVDDHSTDNSWEILQEYAGLDPRFKVFKRPIERKKGGNSARNFAFENSKGDFIQWLDSDDLIHPKKISEQVTELFSYNDNLLAISNWKWIDSSAEIDQENPASKNIPNLESRWEKYPNGGFDLVMWLFKNKFFIPIHSYLIRAELLSKSGLWNEDLIQNQDGEYMVRVLLKCPKVIFNHSVLTYYRRPNSNHLSQQTTYRSWRDMFESFVLCDTWILAQNNSKNTKKVLSFNYERLIMLIVKDYPDIAQMALDRIMFLDPKVRFDKSKPLIIFIGCWIGIKNFLILRNYLLQLRLIKV